MEAAKPWYDFLEQMRFTLPDDDSKDKFTGESWGMRIMRNSERQMDVLAADEAKYKEAMLSDQDAFTGTVGDLQTVRDTGWVLLGLQGEGYRGVFRESLVCAELSQLAATCIITRPAVLPLAVKVAVWSMAVALNMHGMHQ